MKIIHLVHGKCNPNGMNGISRVVYNLNKYEKLEGINSEIWATIDDAKHHYSYKRDEFVTIECYPRVKTPFSSRKIIDDLIKNKNKIDLVHFHMIWFYEKNIIAKSLKKEGIPFIITTHGTYSTDHAYTGKRLLAKWLYELEYLKMAEEIHILTREEGRGLQKYGYNGKSFVAYNGIDKDEIPKKVSENYYKKEIGEDKIIFSWVGVLRKDKNLEELIRAIGYLEENTKKQIKLVIIGPDYKNNAKKYKKLAKSLNCEENIVFKGPLFKQEKYDAIKSSDVYIMPSISEGFSMAILDAMALGKPMVLTSGCNMNYISEKEEFYVKCEPYGQDLKRAIEEIIMKKENFNEIGKKAQTIVKEKLVWEAIIPGLIKDYKRIVRGVKNVG